MKQVLTMTLAYTLDFMENLQVGNLLIMEDLI